MRTSIESQLGAYGRNFFVDGEFFDRDLVGTGLKNSKTVRRSDIVHNEFSGGFRKPSAYQLSLTETWCTSNGMTESQNAVDGRNRQYVYDGLDSLWHPAAPNTSVPARPGGMLDQAITKALLKARDSKVNIALSIGEIQKSVDTIGSRVNAIANAFRQARKGNFAKAAAALGVSYKRKGKAPAKSWLELQYGWMPMLMDIQGLYDVARGPFRNNGMRFRVTGRSKYNFGENYELRDWETPGFTFFQTAQFNYEVNVSLWYEVQNDLLLHASSVGLTNPMEIVYEIIPGSFLLDWILPVGDYLGTLTAAAGLTYISGTCSFIDEGVTNVVANAKPPRSQGVWTYSQSGSGIRGCHVKDFTRSLFPYSPLPAAPRFKNPLSVGHALNALALLRSVLK